MAPISSMTVAVSQAMPPMPGAPPIIAPPTQVTTWLSTAPPMIPTTTGPLQETASIQQVVFHALSETTLLIGLVEVFKAVREANTLKSPFLKW